MGMNVDCGASVVLMASVMVVVGGSSLTFAPGLQRV